MKMITTEDLCRRMNVGPVAVFDVRGDTDYEQGHIPDAKTAPLGSLGFRVAHVMNPGSFVVVYSGGGDCRLASEAAARLQNLGMTNIHCHEAGLAGWRAAGHPVVGSVKAKVHTYGEFVSCRPIVVDREQAYGGVFKGIPDSVEGAGG
ncbi:MAG: rhodanese-like domain-containing protein [Elusimicrobiota bacterium]